MKQHSLGNVKLNNFLESGFTFTEQEYELRLKYMLFNILLSSNAIIVFLASIMRFNNGEIAKGFADITYSILALITIFLVRKYRKLFDILIKFTMIFSILIVSFMFSLNIHSIIGISWFIINLMVVFFLTDKKFSYFIFVLSGGIISYITYYNQEVGCNLTSSIYGIIPLFVAFIFIQFYEKRNSLSQTLLKEQNKNLKIVVEDEVNKSRGKDKLIANQAKMVALGEMMDAIAHQWKQPLSVIKMNVQALSLKADIDKINNEDIEQLNKGIEHQITHLLTTMDEFRSFFRPNQKQSINNIKTVIDETLLLMKDSLIVNKIDIEVIGDASLEILCNQNELKHVFINLINNAKDAFYEHNIEDKKIVFEILNKDGFIVIKIKDNAGGIPENIIDKIFNSNFTTKEEGKGTGIGLYLTKQIIEKLNAEITVENIDNGACFTIINQHNILS